MSVSTDIILYARDATELSEDQVVALLATCQVESIRSIMRFDQVDQAWEDHRQLLSGHNIEDPTYSIVARQVAPKDLWPILSLDYRYHLYLAYSTGWLEVLRAAIRERIPTHIRGDFDINGVSIDLGWRDVVDPHRGDLGWFHGRSICTVTLFGGGMPPNAVDLERALNEIPDLIRLRGQIEAIVGWVGIAVTSFF